MKAARSAAFIVYPGKIAPSGVQLFLEFVESAVQILVGAALLVDLADGVHHRGVVLATELAPNRTYSTLVVAGNQFTLLNSKKYLKADAWAEIDKVRQKLPR